MGKRQKSNLSIVGALGFLRELAVEKPQYLFLGALILLLWGVERWIFSVSSWIPILVAVVATIQYANHQRQIAIEELNRKWKRAVRELTTPIEHCEWLNKLLIHIWPNYFNPMLSTRFSTLVENRLKHRRPKLLEKIELQEFSLGTSPPSLALEGARWSTIDSQKMMHLGFEWDTSDMSILLAAKLAKPLYGTARIIINHLFIKGELQLMPILDGRAILYSFLTVPEVRIGVAFGSGGSQSLPATELPGVSSWLVKLLSETLVKTMVEPRRRCFTLPAVHMRKKVVAGIILVTVVEANQLSRSSLKGSPSRRQQSYNKINSFPEENAVTDLRTFVEVELEQLTRRTEAKKGSSPSWDSTFNMVLHDNAGNLKFHLYASNPGSVKYDYLASCEIKFRYSEDDTTIFWAIGPDSSVIAKQIRITGHEVEMTVPFEGATSGEITVRLVLKEWQFSDGSQIVPLTSHQSIYGSSTNFPAMTGRKIYVTVAEAHNLVRKDKSGKCNPYVKLHYGKAMNKTRTVSDNDTPVWNQRFEFEELGGGEYLALKCFSEETFGDEQIGSARVNLEGLVDGSIKEEWIPLEKVNSGDVKLLIEAVRMENGEGSKGSSNISGNGWIEVVLVEGKDLVAADLRGTSDPYVKVQYGSIKKRTKVIHRTLNPQWHQTLEFVDDGSPLTLYVKDHNAILASSSIGECVIEYQRLPPNHTYDKWIPLQGVKKGEIHVLITRKVPELERRSSVDSDSSPVKSQKISFQMKELLIKLQSMAGDGDIEGLSETVSELESLEDMQEEYMLLLETERSVLLNKVSELGQEIFNSSPSPSRRSPQHSMSMPSIP
ncbi:hypothetical protein V2J09_014870 [Rumex salicifolius]